MVRMLILGTGAMASRHVEFYREAGAEVVAGADVSEERASAFTEPRDIPHAFGSLDDALDWDKFDAVANVTPDAVHHPTTLKLLAAGKPVFCEKPLAPTYALAAEMADAAESAGLPNMVNLRYRNSWTLQEAHELVASGEIGAVRHVEASYLQSWLVGDHWGDWRTEPRWLWRLSDAHGSKGVLGDVGIHILDFACFGANSVPVQLFGRLKTFPKVPGDRIGDYSLDVNDSMAMTVEFENGALGTINATRFATGYANTLKLAIYGDRGAVEVEHHQPVHLDHEIDEMRVCLGDDVNTQTWRTLKERTVTNNYAKFVRAVEEGRMETPDFRHGAELQKLLDTVFVTDLTGEMRRIEPEVHRAEEVPEGSVVGVG